MALETQLVEVPINAAEAYAGFAASAIGAGAIVTFSGVARPKSARGAMVKTLHLQHHPRLTGRSLDRIGADGIARFDISDVLIVHRCGAIAPGETIVFVAVAARHRAEAFHAGEYLMDRLKSEAVFWKREDAGGESRWIDPTEEDRAALERWEQ